MYQDYETDQGLREPSIDPALMTGPGVELAGLPSPDFPAVAAASAQPVEQLVPLGTQIRRIIHTHSAGQLTTEQATRAILNAVIDVLPLPDGAVDAEAWGENAADHDRPPTAAGYLEYLLERLRAANGPTYGPPLTISASAVWELVEPGVAIQVLDTGDEQTWHRLQLIGECDGGDRCDNEDHVPGECIVIVSDAFPPDDRGECRVCYPETETLTVRIAAVTA